MVNPYFSNLLMVIEENSGIKFKHIVEVGTFYPEYSNLISFIEDKTIRVELFEPNPYAYVKLLNVWGGGYGNVKIHNCAICDINGKVRFFIPPIALSGFCGTSGAFVDGVISPVLMGPNKDKNMGNGILIDGYTFDIFDDGTIDALIVDAEGSEYYVIKHMISRPYIISLEMVDENDEKTFNYDNIIGWMKENKYANKFTNDADKIWIREN